MRVRQNQHDQMNCNMFLEFLVLEWSVRYWKTVESIVALMGPQRRETGLVLLAAGNTALHHLFVIIIPNTHHLAPAPYH